MSEIVVLGHGTFILQVVSLLSLQTSTRLSLLVMLLLVVKSSCGKVAIVVLEIVGALFTTNYNAKAWSSFIVPSDC